MSPFSYQRRVAFADTDAMGVTHHAAYVRYIEEARVAWMRERGLSGTHFPHVDRVLAVLHVQVWHLRSSTFEDVLDIRLQVRRQGPKIHYQYIVEKAGTRIAEAETLHIPVDLKLKPARPTAELMQQLEKEAWTETWLSNS